MYKIVVKLSPTLLETLKNSTLRYTDRDDFVHLLDVPNDYILEHFTEQNGFKLFKYYPSDDSYIPYGKEQTYNVDLIAYMNESLYSNLNTKTTPENKQNYNGKGLIKYLQDRN